MAEQPVYVTPDSPDPAITPELALLYERVAAGIDWLTAHDPVGAFNAWYEARLTADSPMPSPQTPETPELWRAYYTQRARWERMFQRMERLEIETNVLPRLRRWEPFGWQPEGDVRR